MAIETYLHIDADNVRSKIIEMMNGESISVRVSSFCNDMKNINTCDDVLTLLVLNNISPIPNPQSPFIYLIIFVFIFYNIY